MLKVKYCGLTRAQDARLAGELGVDAIGLILYKKSPRYVTLEGALRIVHALPPWTARVGVFVNEEPAIIKQAIDALGLSAIQLHGDESPAFIEALALHVPVIKALSATGDWPQRVQEYMPYPVLLDHATPDSPGGTGQTWDWSKMEPESRPGYFILAGGLTADNVKDAVDSLRPDAVDVSSGVERSPGIKDSDRMQAFMKAVAQFRVQEYRNL